SAMGSRDEVKPGYRTRAREAENPAPAGAGGRTNPQESCPAARPAGSGRLPGPSTRPVTSRGGWDQAARDDLFPGDRHRRCTSLRSGGSGPATPPSGGGSRLRPAVPSRQRTAASTAAHCHRKRLIHRNSQPGLDNDPRHAAGKSHRTTAVMFRLRSLWIASEPPAEAGLTTLARLTSHDG